MGTLLSEVSMSLGSAYASYLLKLVMYVAVAAAGIYAGIRLRKNKDKKKQQEDE